MSWQHSQQVQHVSGFLPWLLFGRLLLLAQCVDFDVRLFYVAVPYLVYGCGNVPQITAESRDTPPIHCAEHVQQSVDMSMQVQVSAEAYRFG